MISVPHFETVSQELKSTILRVYNYRCKECGSDSKTLDLHHIVPRRIGGLNSIQNLIPLCKECHVYQHGMSTRLTLARDESDSLRTTVPISVRKTLGLTTYDTIRWIVDDDTVYIKKQTDAN